ncbi:Hypp4674 [Branchiostoma lanceolatum]|uniref:Hypp4674 protein n=1 Tax=Branchiostoma lanceolatum TaxID=7740 RepID=A0A8K0A8Z6_BRALA|nr:Hypp4674 [Branchiostoma lanceolatum]
MAGLRAGLAVSVLVVLYVSPVNLQQLSPRELSLLGTGKRGRLDSDLGQNGNGEHLPEESVDGISGVPASEHYKLPADGSSPAPTQNGSPVGEDKAGEMIRATDGTRTESSLSSQRQDDPHVPPTAPMRPRATRRRSGGRRKLKAGRPVKERRRHGQRQRVSTHQTSLKKNQVKTTRKTGQRRNAPQGGNQQGREHPLLRGHASKNEGREDVINPASQGQGALQRVEFPPPGKPEQSQLTSETSTGGIRQTPPRGRQQTGQKQRSQISEQVARQPAVQTSIVQPSYNTPDQTPPQILVNSRGKETDVEPSNFDKQQSLNLGDRKLGNKGGHFGSISDQGTWSSQDDASPSQDSQSTPVGQQGVPADDGDENGPVYVFTQNGKPPSMAQDNRNTPPKVRQENLTETKETVRGVQGPQQGAPLLVEPTEPSKSENANSQTKLNNRAYEIPVGAKGSKPVNKNSNDSGQASNAVRPFATGNRRKEPHARVVVGIGRDGNTQLEIVGGNKASRSQNTTKSKPVEIDLNETTKKKSPKEKQGTLSEEDGLKDPSSAATHQAPERQHQGHEQRFGTRTSVPRTRTKVQHQNVSTKDTNKGSAPERQDQGHEQRFSTRTAEPRTRTKVQHQNVRTKDTNKGSAPERQDQGHEQRFSTRTSGPRTRTKVQHQNGRTKDTNKGSAPERQDQGHEQRFSTRTAAPRTRIKVQHQNVSTKDRNKGSAPGLQYPGHEQRFSTRTSAPRTRTKVRHQDSITKDRNKGSAPKFLHPGQEQRVQPGSGRDPEKAVLEKAAQNRCA